MYTHTHIELLAAIRSCQWTSACRAPIAANPPHASAAVDRWDRQTDRQQTITQSLLCILCGQSEITSYAVKVLNGLWNQNVLSKPTLLSLDSRTFDVVHRSLLTQSARYDLARLMYHLSRLAAALGTLPSVLWRCWLGGRKGIRPVKTEWWGVGMVICLERGADLHMAQLMPLPLTVSCFSKIQITFTFPVPAHPGSPGKGPLNGCVCV